SWKGSSQLDLACLMSNSVFKISILKADINIYLRSHVANESIHKIRPLCARVSSAARHDLDIGPDSAARVAAYLRRVGRYRLVFCTQDAKAQSQASADGFSGKK